jgi:hypothetical protein
MPEFKIRYNYGRTQKVTADKYGAYGEFFAFDANGADIFNVAIKEVESVGRADIADPEGPGPIIA